MSLELINLSACYENKKHETVFELKPVSFSVPKGNCLALIGPSGSGKSTLLKAMAGLVESKGDLLFDGHPLMVNEVAFIGEVETLYKGKNIFESLAFPMKIAKMDENEIKSRIYHIAGDLGFFNLLTRYPKELSLGQKKIIEFSKCVLKSPEVMLLDEPFFAVDPGMKTTVWAYLNQMKRDLKSTFIIASHEEEEIENLAELVFDLATYKTRKADKRNETADRI